MLDFGFSEVVLTSLVALVVLGPEKLPKVARQVGNWMGRARHMARQLTDQLEREVNAEELLRETKAKPARPMTPDPAPFDTSAFPPADSAPAGNPAQPLPVPDANPAVEAAPSSPAAPYSADPVVSPHGADWHPAPADPKPPNE
jgi:sec-independent protein translocase protein TatB